MQNNELVFPATNSLEENAKIWAEHYNNIIKPRHGLFLDFSQSPEFEKPCIEYITKHFGWVLEKPFFIRKPEI
jgi:hypothetical protein